jgi:imidazoleglycerol-phosphate dehydratase
MLTLFAKHGCFDLELIVKGDLEVDIHHSNEDTGICLGQAFLKALGDKKQIRRFAGVYCAMDEALARVVLDLSNRAYLRISPAALKRNAQAEYRYNDFKQFLQAFVSNARMTLHLDVIRGEDTHHILEACFKALALALKEAVSIDPRKRGVPSTKGIL